MKNAKGKVEIPIFHFSFCNLHSREASRGGFMATGILPASLLGSVAIVNTTTGIDGAAVRIVEEPERPTIYTVQGGTFYYQAISRSYITLRVSAVGYITKDQGVNLKPSTLNQVVVFLTKV